MDILPGPPQRPRDHHCLTLMSCGLIPLIFVSGRSTVSIGIKTLWSHKLKAPGRRWLSITNARGQIQRFGGPNLPTPYDGDLTILNAAALDELFGKCHMIGDNHFKKAGDFFSKITLFTNVSKARTVGGVKIPATPSNEEEEDSNILAERESGGTWDQLTCADNNTVDPY
jgi:hypothetical protein